MGKSSGVIEALRLLGTAGLASVFGLHFGRHRALQNIPDFFPSSKNGLVGLRVEGWVGNAKISGV